jgi:hypothetical protein
MSCVLRVSGENFNIHTFKRVTGLKPCAVFIKGKPRYPKTKPDGEKYARSGANVTISTVDFDDFDEQIRDSIEFLKQCKGALRSYMNLNEGKMVLDYGVSRKDVFVQSDEFPSELLLLAGDLGISIMLSQYPGKEVITRKLISAEISRLLNDEISITYFGDEMVEYFSLENDSYVYEAGHENLIRDVLEEFLEMHDAEKPNPGYMPTVPSRERLMELRALLDR